jgi:hypothetical protein
VSVPVRALVSGAAATVKLNDPDPVADVPPVAVIHEVSERPVHAHELPVEMVIEPVPPAAPIVTDDDDRVKVQVAGVGVAGPEPQPEIATTHATNSTRVRMADDPLGNSSAWTRRPYVSSGGPSVPTHQGSLLTVIPAGSLPTRAAPLGRHQARIA